MASDDNMRETSATAARVGTEAFSGAAKYRAGDGSFRIRGRKATGVPMFAEGLQTPDQCAKTSGVESTVIPQHAY